MDSVTVKNTAKLFARVMLTQNPESYFELYRFDTLDIDLIPPGYEVEVVFRMTSKAKPLQNMDIYETMGVPV